MKITRALRLGFKTLGWLTLAVALVVGVAGAFAFKYYLDFDRRAERFDLSAIHEQPQRSQILDHSGQLHSYLPGENRVVVSLDDVSPHFIDALIVREDSRFWQHRGVDYHAIVRAALANFRSREVKQGASTITQQLARNTFELTERTLDRKALEALLAQRIEKGLSKKEILTAYVNRIYFGNGSYGIETAARCYFGKKAGELSIAEAAMLAGVICSPSRLDPTRDPVAAKKERDEVIGRMVALGKITTAEGTTAKATPIVLTQREEMRVEDDDIVSAVKRELTTILPEDVIHFGGLKIYCTIDPDLQRMAQEAADRQLTKIEGRKNFPHPRKTDFTPERRADGTEKPTDYLQAAIAVVDNQTGALRAVVGGRDYAQSKYLRALAAERQVGSTFKPFVYAAAYERGLAPYSMVDDSQIDPATFPDNRKNWTPANSDGKYLGYQRADFGLIMSRNTMAMRVGQWAGLEGVRALARNVGIGRNIPNYPVTFLGAFETTVKDLAGAYTVFPNHGLYRAPYVIERVDDFKGRVLYQAAHEGRQVMRQNTAAMVTNALQHVMKSGTASKSAALGWKRPGAGKTGTTNDFHDAWFVGFTSSLTCAVWVGMDQPTTIMEKGYGSALALPIWVDLMNAAPASVYATHSLNSPGTLTQVAICTESGSRATAQCTALRKARIESIPTGVAGPEAFCHLHPEYTPAQTFTQTPGAVSPPVASNAPASGAVGDFSAPTPTDPRPSISGSILDTPVRDPKEGPDVSESTADARLGNVQVDATPRLYKDEYGYCVMQRTGKRIYIWRVSPEKARQLLADASRR